MYTSSTYHVSVHFSKCRRLRKIAKKLLLGSSCLAIRLSVRMEELGSSWTDFLEILFGRGGGVFAEIKFIDLYKTHL